MPERGRGTKEQRRVRVCRLDVRKECSALASSEMICERREDRITIINVRGGESKGEKEEDWLTEFVYRVDMNVHERVVMPVKDTGR